MVPLEAKGRREHQCSRLLEGEMFGSNFQGRLEPSLGEGWT